MRIFCPLLHRTLGDFIEQAVFAATVKEQFDRAELDVYFVDDRPYKKCVLEMLPHFLLVQLAVHPLGRELALGSVEEVQPVVTSAQSQQLCRDEETGLSPLPWS